MVKKSKVSITKIIGISLIAIGIIVIGGSVALNVRQYQAERNALQVFRADIVEDTTAPEAKEETVKEIKEGDALYVLRIPSIDSENLVREGVGKEILADALGHEPDTAYAGQVGNCVIAGHRNYTFGKFFNRLDEVQLGDELYIDCSEGTYKYKVTDIKVVEPTQVEILSDTEVEQITLYTCTPIYVATHRLVITAERQQ